MIEPRPEPQSELQAELQTNGIRPATPRDIGALAELHLKTWQTAYAHILPPDRLAALRLEKLLQSWEENLRNPERCHLVAEQEGKVAGFLSYGPPRLLEGAPGSADPSRDTREIYALYIHPDHWRSGWGKRLMDRALAEIFAGECSSVILWTWERNTVARAFYEKLGFLLEGSKIRDRFGAPLTELCYRKRR